MTVDLQNINKSFGSTTAVADVSLEVQPGELFGLIGPDGAGKTTLLRILSTLLLADSGNATVLGFDVVADYKVIRTRIGYMPGKFSLYQDLSVRENLEFFATLYGTNVDSNTELIHDIYVHLEPFANRKAGKLSGGMKQKLALCCALIHKPELLVLDEPTTGVDPVSRRELWEMLGRLKQSGITIVASTPYMDEAVLCDRIALMQGGRIMKVNTPAQIVAEYQVPLYSVQADNHSLLRLALQQCNNVQTAFAFGDVYHVTLHNTVSDAHITLAAVLQSRYGIAATIEQVQPTIEDCFISMAGNAS